MSTAVASVSVSCCGVPVPVDDYVAHLVGRHNFGLEAAKGIAEKAHPKADVLPVPSAHPVIHIHNHIHYDGGAGSASSVGVGVGAGAGVDRAEDKDDDRDGVETDRLGNCFELFLQILKLEMFVCVRHWEKRRGLFCTLFFLFTKKKKIPCLFLQSPFPTLPPPSHSGLFL